MYDSLLGAAFGAVGDLSLAQMHKEIVALRPNQPGYEQRLEKLANKHKKAIAYNAASQPRRLFMANLDQFDEDIIAALANKTMQPVDTIFFMAKSASADKNISFFDNNPSSSLGISNINQAKLDAGFPAFIYGIGLEYAELAQGEKIETKDFGALPGVVKNGIIDLQFNDRIVLKAAANKMFDTQGVQEALPYKQAVLLNNPKVWKDQTLIKCEVKTAENCPSGAALKLFLYAIQVVKA